MSKYVNLKDVFFDGEYNVGRGMATYDESLNQSLFNVIPSLDRLVENDLALAAIFESEKIMTAIYGSKVASDKILINHNSLRILGESQVAVNMLLENSEYVSKLIGMDSTRQFMIDSETWMRKISHSNTAVKVLLNDVSWRSSMVGSTEWINGVLASEEVFASVGEVPLAVDAIITNTINRDRIINDPILFSWVTNDLNWLTRFMSSTNSTVRTSLLVKKNTNIPLMVDGKMAIKTPLNKKGSGHELEGEVIDTPNYYRFGTRSTTQTSVYSPYYSERSYNLTNVDKIIFRMKTITATSTPPTWWVGVNVEDQNPTNTFDAKCTSSISSTDFVDYTVDVSALTGFYYLKFMGSSNNTAGSIGVAQVIFKTKP